ncbi:unnamed protein product, partial [Ectocarpus sp. 13 AM-2016]
MKNRAPELDVLLAACVRQTSEPCPTRELIDGSVFRYVQCVLCKLFFVFKEDSVYCKCFFVFWKDGLHSTFKVASVNPGWKQWVEVGRQLWVDAAFSSPCPCMPCFEVCSLQVFEFFDSSSVDFRLC